MLIISFAVKLWQSVFDLRLFIVAKKIIDYKSINFFFINGINHGHHSQKNQRLETYIVQRNSKIYER